LDVHGSGRLAAPRGERPRLSRCPGGEPLREDIVMAVTADQETLPLDTQAVLLLCGAFTQKETTKPLTLVEYNALASWLSKVGRRPADLLSITDGLLPPDDPKLPDANRVRGLLDRGVQMATALERWEAMGLWVVSRVEDRYPKSLRQKLRSFAP